MRKRSVVTAVMGLIVVGYGLAPSVAYAAKPARVFVQVGKDLKGQQADETTCTDYAKGVPTPGMPPMVTTGGVAGAAGAALATGFLAGLEEAKARRAGYERCMRARGYIKVTLAPAEEAALRGAKGQPAREAWFTNFLSQTELAQRIEAAKAQIQDLPEVPSTPASTDGLVLDLAQAKLAEGPANEGGVLLVIPASHLATARLAADYPVSNMLGVNKRGEAGALFHAVARGPYSTQWCGPFLNNSIQGQITMTGCVEAVGDDFKVVNAVGESWLAGDLDAGGFPVDAPPKLEVSPIDLLGPVTLTLALDKITKKGVRLKVFGERDGKAVTIWRGGGNFDAEGRLVVPLWTHRLTLIRRDQGIAGVLTADGDGKGWWSTGTP
ncbi:hypothetical protein [Caulobacter sp.]|uniref:hypothetical protein n=1 Tax=Caulobacter sp. TaxID=78 RepID=UPI003BB148C7